LPLAKVYFFFQEYYDRFIFFLGLQGNEKHASEKRPCAQSCALKWLNWVKTVALRARVSTEFLASPKIPDVFL
jgi:hypothetical protein